jgi:hypothetical protein
MQALAISEAVYVVRTIQVKLRFPDVRELFIGEQTCTNCHGYPTNPPCVCLLKVKGWNNEGHEKLNDKD